MDPELDELEEQLAEQQEEVRAERDASLDG